MNDVTTGDLPRLKRSLGGGEAREGRLVRGPRVVRDAGPSARVSRWRAMPAGGRRSEAGAPCGGGAGRALRACGPRADRRSAFQAGGLPRRSGGWWFLRSRDPAQRPYATPAASGGLCRLKPAFQAGGAMPAWRRPGRCAP